MLEKYNQLKRFGEGAAALMLPVLESLPLRLNLGVGFHFGIRLGISESEALIVRDKIGKEERIYSFALIIGAHGNQQ